jgi:hypothetical protein
MDMGLQIELGVRLLCVEVYVAFSLCRTTHVIVFLRLITFYRTATVTDLT